MPMFVILSKATEDGAKNVADMQRIGQQNRESAEKLGIKLHGWYMTQGRYDFVIIAEAPDEETMMAQGLSVSGRGGSRTETLRAFTMEEAQQILGKLG